MGSNNSTESNFRKIEEGLEKQRQEIEKEKKILRQLLKENSEAEKKRLHQQAVNEHLAAVRLQEEQRCKEAAEKWRQEKQQKEAYAALQRQVEELKIQQQMQIEQQKIFQQHQASATLPTTLLASDTVRETVNMQQKVLPVSQSNQIPNESLSASLQIKPTQSNLRAVLIVVNPEKQKNLPVSQSNQIPNDTSLNASSPIKPAQSTTRQAALSRNVVPERQKNLSVSQSNQIRDDTSLNASSPIKQAQSTTRQAALSRNVVPERQKNLPVSQSNQIPNDTSQSASSIKPTPYINLQAAFRSNIVVPERQKNLSVSQSNQIRNDTSLNASSPIKQAQSTTRQAALSRNVVPDQQQKLPVAQSNKIANDTSLNASSPIKPAQSTTRQAALSRNVVPERQKNLPVSQSNQIQNDTSQSALSIKPTPSTNLQAAFRSNIVVPEQQKKLSQKEPLQKNVSETSMSYKRASEDSYKWSIVNYVSEQNSISKTVAENIIALLDNNNTVPFIARYKKNMTQGMGMNTVRKVKNSYDSAKSIKKQALSIINYIKKKGNWTPEFQAFVNSSKSLVDLSYIHSICKDSSARNLGLENIGEAIITGKSIAPLSSFVKPETEGLANEDQVKNSIVCIIAHTMRKDKRVFDMIEKVKTKYPIVVETKFANANLNVQTMNQESYAEYENFVSVERTLEPDEIFHINRGEEQNILNVNIIISQSFYHSFTDRCLQLFEDAVKASQLHKQLISEAISYMYNTWTKPFISKSTRDEMTKRAEKDTMEMIAEKIQAFFFTLPIRDKSIISIISISQVVCKVAVVSDRGILLACDTINPHNTDNQSSIRDVETRLVNMVHKYKCTIFAVSNDKMVIKNVNFLEGLIKKKAFGAMEVTYSIVDDVGLSDYVRSPKASLEFPRFDKDIITAVSIARRLQNPIDELVKIETKHLVPKTFLKDVPEKQLIAILDEVIMGAVSIIGVDLNTASADRLKRVAGLNEATAKRIVEWRQLSGPFTNRQDLLKVKGISNEIFQQCAGFIQIMPETAVGNDGQRSQHSLNQLDQTQIHPESYDIATAFLSAAKCNINQLGSRGFIFTVKLFADQDHATLAEKFGTTKDNIELIARAFTMERTTIVKGKDDINVNTITPAVVHPIEPNLPTTSTGVNSKNKSSFPIKSTVVYHRSKRSKQNFDNLVIGMVLIGVVNDVKHYGAFVNVGMGKPGLIRNKFMNGITLTVGQRVETTVNEIDKERRLFNLQLVKCI